MFPSDGQPEIYETFEIFNLLLYQPVLPHTDICCLHSWDVFKIEDEFWTGETQTQQKNEHNSFVNLCNEIKTFTLKE